MPCPELHLYIMMIIIMKRHRHSVDGRVKKKCFYTDVRIFGFLL